MSKPPEALRLADALENDLEQYDGLSLPKSSQSIADSAAAELRRLHEVNAELLRMFSSLLLMCKRQKDFNDDGDGMMFDRALAAIAKAEAA